MLKPTTAESKTDLETDGRVVIVQRVQAPRPATVTDTNCGDVLGVDKKRFRKLLRQLRIACVMTPGGPVALLSEVEAAMRAHGRVMGEAEKKSHDENSFSGDLDLSAAAAAAGLRLTGGAR